MKKLSPKSQAILDRAILHRDRCLFLALHLGEDTANVFHLRFKGDPGCEHAEQEYKKLIEAAEN